jgi:hypothetical protein
LIPAGFARSVAIFAIAREVATPMEAGSSISVRSSCWISLATRRAVETSTSRRITAASSMLYGITVGECRRSTTRTSREFRSYFAKSGEIQTASGQSRAAIATGIALRTPAGRAS